MRNPSRILKFELTTSDGFTALRVIAIFEGSPMSSNRNKKGDNERRYYSPVGVSCVVASLDRVLEFSKGQDWPISAFPFLHRYFTRHTRTFASQAHDSIHTAEF